MVKPLADRIARLRPGGSTRHRAVVIDRAADGFLVYGEGQRPMVATHPCDAAALARRLAGDA